ncbi:MAG: methyltransferase, partial [Planctomycetaceae bacterium]
MNLVQKTDRRHLFEELYRVLKAGGRAVISDIVSNIDVPLDLQNDAQLWSGCISGAFREDQFLEAFSDAGFHGMHIVSRQAEPWAVVEGIEFRSVTVEAHKSQPMAGEKRQGQVIYHGPWRAVIDDLGQKLFRGQRIEVAAEPFSRYCCPPYAGCMTTISSEGDASDA